MRQPLLRIRFPEGDGTGKIAVYSNRIDIVSPHAVNISSEPSGDVTLEFLHPQAAPNPSFTTKSPFGGCAARGGGTISILDPDALSADLFSLEASGGIVFDAGMNWHVNMLDISANGSVSIHGNSTSVGTLRSTSSGNFKIKGVHINNRAEISAAGRADGVFTANANAQLSISGSGMASILVNGIQKGFMGTSWMPNCMTRQE
mmetsp:Transcript_24646/g.42437  ORF Transcript_24646/g.42437 Transcript_24646/m.42437 type:complete len:203 (+) Transcript_24646:235-843(+)|eukprot:CAMPEP_0196651820 /NCGR_PEP_ID=MMETSP1086-20130531/959_1 /TAXON_ID=77921 /ORGANISM="Cyanoptyche  gloeocystis , Strain SAG4.97" /LENGTH=202 /DNA_ID=CAMNT_0041982043 /DNA_START=219 /DNA_END=827 /DNA_ORIENTATION=-